VYLKQLEILGFKSFPNKTTVKFTDGITAIVGPNGCGKTNILDALRWVLGEQRPSLLRGGKMEEVIFNGTGTLKPLGMGEVSLTVVNDRGVLPTDYSEVRITRRLYRSGESEYLLNKVPCRLKDITDLFVDTGMGAHSYSVIQQDMIEAVISDKAEERRFLFEEAAGITKYKQRKRAALRKMEATETDILRLNDIYSEVKTRVNSLVRQHKKAERYEKLQNRIRGWELYLNANRVSEIANEKRELRAKRDELEIKRIASQTSIDGGSAGLESGRSELLEIERSVSGVNKEIFTITEKAHNLEREISVLQEKRSNARTLIEKNNTEIISLRSRTAELTEQITESDQQRTIHSTKLEEANTALATADSAQAEADRELLLARSSREDVQQKLLELEGKLSSGKAEEESLNEQQEELEALLSGLEEEIAAKSPRQKELVSQATEHRRKLDELLSKKSELQKSQDDLTSELDRLLEKSEQLSEELASAQASMEASEARYALLEEMLLHYEGYDSGVVTAMERRSEWPGIAGTVAELFVPADGMEAAVEAALGDIAKCLVCYDRKTAEEIIAFLRAGKKGRVGVLVPDIGTIHPAVKRPELNHSGVRGWLDSFVTTDDRLQPLLSAILSRTVLFEPGIDIDELLKRLPIGFSAVSTDAVFYGNHLIYGGSDDSAPLFRRKERMHTEKELLAKWRSSVAELQEQRNQTIAAIAVARAESTGNDGRLDSVIEDLDSARKMADASDYEQRTLSTELDRLGRERKTLSEKLERIKGRQYSLGIGRTELTGEREVVQSRILGEKNRLEEFEQKASLAQSAFSRIQVTAIEVRSSVDQNENQLKHLKELLSEIGFTVTTKSSEITQAEQEVTTSERRTVELEKLLKGTFEQRETYSTKEEELRQTQSEIAARVNARENDIKTIRKEASQISEELHKADLRIQSTESEIQTLVDRMREEHNIDIRSISPVLPEEDLSEATEPRHHLHQLKEKLKGFGAVNLLALEEFNEANEREKFLREQLEDLSAARNDLQSTITKINQTAKKLFEETFIQVETHFKSIFSELFTGGDAAIHLTDQSDPLESDIEIVARPGGKKHLSITMMSGGERALTAISLLFALSLAKTDIFHWQAEFCRDPDNDSPLGGTIELGDNQTVAADRIGKYFYL